MTRTWKARDCVAARSCRQVLISLCNALAQQLCFGGALRGRGGALQKGGGSCLRGHLLDVCVQCRQLLMQLPQLPCLLRPAKENMSVERMTWQLSGASEEPKYIIRGGKSSLQQAHSAWWPTLPLICRELWQSLNFEGISPMMALLQ